MKGSQALKKLYVNGCLFLFLPVLVMMFMGLIPECARFLEYNRELIFHGELWRLWTGHFIHWTAEHLFWDLMAFVILGYLLWKESRAVYYWILLGTPTLISLVMILVENELTLYRGISGVDSALFFALALLYVTTKDLGLRYLGSAMFVCGGSKLLYEIFLSKALFVSSESFTVIHSAHWSGALLGLLCVLLCSMVFIQPSGE